MTFDDNAAIELRGSRAMPTPRTLSSTARAGLLAEAGPAASRLLTTVEAAALLDLSPRTLERRRTAQNPVLPHVESPPC